TVIAPAIATPGLTSGSVKQMRFTLTQRVERVSREAPGVTKLRMDAGARSAKTDGKIPLPIHCCAPHPTPRCVRLIRALLEHSDWSGCHIAQLEPAQACHVARFHGVGADNRFVIAKISIRQAKHQTVSYPIKIVCAGHSALRHAGASGRAKRGETSGRRIGERGEGGVSGRHEVHMKMVSGVVWVRSLSGKSHEAVRSACGRQPGAVEITGQKRINRSTKRSDWTNERGRLSIQHFAAIKRERLRPKVLRASRVEDIHAHVIAVRPDAKVRIIKEI